MREPILLLIREVLGNALKSLPANELDRMAYKKWIKESDEYDEYCKQERNKGNKSRNFSMREPMLSLIREELGNALRSLPADELDRMAYEICEKKNAKYKEYLKEEGNIRNDYWGGM